MTAINIRLTEEQKAALQAAADRDKLPLVTWAREMLLRSAGRKDLGALKELALRVEQDPWAQPLTLTLPHKE